MIKKITIAVFGLAVSGFAFSGTMGPVCSPGNVTVPCEAKRWDLGIQALYLKAAYDANNAYQYNFTPNLNYLELKNKWDWGVRLEGSYHYGTGNDITLDWMHYKDKVNQSGFGLLIFPAGGNQVLQLTPSDTVNVQNRMDQVNLVIGQHVNFSSVDKMRFYGGLQYASIRTNASDYYTNLPQLLLAQLQSTAVSQFNNADFNGVGPVVGMDLSYDLISGLSLTAKGAGSILFGTSRLSQGIVFSPSNLVFASRYASKKEMVSSLEAKLGLNYAYNIAQGVVNLEGGYQAVNYLNAIQSSGINGIFGSVTNSSFGLYGPYFGVKYEGNA